MERPAPTSIPSLSGFATGLWHGASWNFVLWGLFYGFLIMIEKAFLLRALDRLPAVFSHLYFLVGHAHRLGVLLLHRHEPGLGLPR